MSDSVQLAPRESPLYAPAGNESPYTNAQVHANELIPCKTHSRVDCKNAKIKTIAARAHPACTVLLLSKFIAGIASCDRVTVLQFYFIPYTNI